ncbi:hypothetical protein [Sphingomonas kyeonggiensis]|uniref:Uncharacterized protein n=1 Tax=Sphingomonas kyeonggiensis TaxID=1268553 RepID=A0A7W6JVP7_9SPHN|nr:hypothetical protein [Sphingomonas kyeonggiensis]MBB4099346.1 hypothetical protein [Sphingomonas kyeonggiensis]
MLLQLERVELPQPRSIETSLPAMASPNFSRLERQALVIGIMDGRKMRSRSRLQRLFVFFDNFKSIPLANPHLEALRAFAELSRASLPCLVPAATLEELGFSRAQIEAARESVAADAALERRIKPRALEE